MLVLNENWNLFHISNAGPHSRNKSIRDVHRPRMDICFRTTQTIANHFSNATTGMPFKFRAARTFCSTRKPTTVIGNSMWSAENQKATTVAMETMDAIKARYEFDGFSVQRTSLIFGRFRIALVLKTERCSRTTNPAAKRSSFARTAITMKTVATDDCCTTNVFADAIGRRMCNALAPTNASATRRTSPYPHHRHLRPNRISQMKTAVTKECRSAHHSRVRPKTAFCRRAFHATSSSKIPTNCKFVILSISQPPTEFEWINVKV